MDLELGDTLRAMAAAREWEIAKGHLRALAAIQGHKRLVVRCEEVEMDRASERWRNLESRIEGFIKSVEDCGLHE